VQEAVRSGHTSDYDGEIIQFAQIVSVAPEYETLQSLWPLLMATVPHFRSKQYQDWRWDSIIDFIAKRVESEPFLAIKLYAMMYDNQVASPRWHIKKDEERKIIETAAKNKESKQLACV
jgi:hypothetical protein